MKYIPDSKIKEAFIEYGLEFTNDLYQAIYLLRDGTLVSGMYEGVRSEDHRCIECLFSDIGRYTPGFWDTALQSTGMVMLIPETNQWMIAPGQKLTSAQKEILSNLEDYEETN